MIGKDNSLKEWRDTVESAEMRGGYVEAYDVARQALENYPEDVWFAHRAVLALARSGATERAQIFYDELGLSAWEKQEEDVAALAARISKDQALLSSPSAARSHWLDAAKRFKAAGLDFPSHVDSKVLPHCSHSN